MGRTILFFVVVLCSACASRPAPTIVERNYESGERIKQVKIGGDYYWAFTLPESESEAKARLMSEVSKECPRHSILAEGKKENERTVIGSRFNNVTNRTDVTSEDVTDVYLWVRYRCEKDGSDSSSSATAPTSISVTEAKAAAFQAVARKCGEDYARGLDAASALVDLRLQNAGFALQEQAAIAKKLLLQEPRDERLREYLIALGVRPEGEQMVREAYFRLMQVSAQDILRWDAYQREAVALFYNTYLKEAGAKAESGLACRPPLER